MGSLLPKASNVKNAAWTIAILALAYRFGGKDVIEGRSKLFGIF